MLRLKLPHSEAEYPLDRLSFEKEDDGYVFILASTQEENISISIPYVLTLYETYTPEKFDCYPFSSPTYYKEQDIFEVKVSDKKVNRIGWIFPVQSLSSIDHAFSGNEHFLRYAFVSFKKLLLGEYFIHDLVFEVSEPVTQINITDIYRSELIVFCCSKEKTEKISDFNLNHYIPYLYSSKYLYCSNPQELDLLKKEQGDRVSRDLVLREISILLRTEVFITTLFKDLLKRNNHPLVQFHLLYQVVEILINKIYDTEVSNIVLASQSKKKTSYEILGEINKIQKEEYRVTKLIDGYLRNPPTTITHLRSACNQVLQFVDHTPNDHIGICFYKVRNAVVHNFRVISMKDTNNSVFAQFVDVFERFIIEVIISYKDEITEFSFHPIEWLNYQLQNEKRS